ncbi:2,3-bisphosphoglycerate-dependent phosphoglycerate mutase [Latilactobacillus curvatus]|uniref:2,3-bisphosphoglycerate-dependent phosphoglycerate mutase n=1 Tax=Latilactobacillus curvatus TaxID=28038 RepID=UPI002411999B|nr:2,3-bisphosphoglycerate-dependent phosphoglycerate mutase [Latilactobacillus curvatus]MDG2979283.1 2,3-bisphosphoglycerate-dependent phosphoglycerate mutase [Latilactobacillus curvatus]
MILVKCIGVFGAVIRPQTPFWEDEIAPKLIDGQNIIVAAHGNSLRALTKYIENISDEDIMDVGMATGEPVVYDLDENLNVVSKKKLN